MGLFTYIRGSDLSDAEIAAGLADATLSHWRTGSDGERWFKKSRLPVIHDVPKTVADEIAGDFEEIADDDDGSVSFDFGSES